MWLVMVLFVFLIVQPAVAADKVDVTKPSVQVTTIHFDAKKHLPSLPNEQHSNVKPDPKKDFQIFGDQDKMTIQKSILKF